MRRLCTLLLFVAALTLGASGCDLFGPDSEGGSGNPDGGESDPTLVVTAGA